MKRTCIALAGALGLLALGSSLTHAQELKIQDFFGVWAPSGDTMSCTYVDDGESGDFTIDKDYFEWGYGSICEVTTTLSGNKLVLRGSCDGIEAGYQVMDSTMTLVRDNVLQFSYMEETYMRCTCTMQNGYRNCVREE